MEILFEEKGLRVLTRGRDRSPITYKDKGILLSASDEIPFFYKAGDSLGGMVIDQEASLKKSIMDAVVLVLEKHRPEEIVCYLGPSLSFSNVIVERRIQEELIKNGYQAACKRTSGVDYLDLPLLNFLYLRELGIPAENIFLSPYDTFDTEGLYSKKRGDKESNENVASIVKEK